MIKRTRTCNKCYWYRPHQLDKSQGSCYYHAPRPALFPIPIAAHGLTDYEVIWPYVDSTDFCSTFKSRTSKI